MNKWQACFTNALSFTLAFLVMTSTAGAFAAAVAEASSNKAGGAAAANAGKYPRITEVSGTVVWTGPDGKSAAPKKNQLLLEKATVETLPAGGAAGQAAGKAAGKATGKAAGKATVQLDAQRRVQLWPGTRIDIPAISWESNEAPTVILKYGTLRWKQPSKASYNIALTSDLFEFVPSEGDYIFSFSPKAATAEVKVIQGKMLFSAMNAEDSAEVSAGQKCVFQGVKEGDEIVYDILLKGKKIPRGHLQKVLPFSAEEKKSYSAESLRKEAAALKRQEVAAKKAEENAKDPLQICSKPLARYNQCAWICANNPAGEKKSCRLDKSGVQCLRERCNANGDWAEITEMPQEKAATLCGPVPKVRNCDY